MRTDNFPLTLLYDAGCPVCSLEMDHLRERDRHGRLCLVDISAPGFDATAFGLDWSALDAELHALCPDGGVVRGVAALRLAYGAVGLGWLLGATGWPVLRPVFDSAYKIFARHRRTISRAAAPLIDLLRARRARRSMDRMQRCSTGECKALQPASDRGAP
jgi:predicted DCC family thiol-disulfide oxidoreductase YuxK